MMGDLIKVNFQIYWIKTQSTDKELCHKLGSLEWNDE